jgi:hypothetical protein
VSKRQLRGAQEYNDIELKLISQTQARMQYILKNLIQSQKLAYVVI